MFFDEYENLRDSDLESTFFHEVGHLILNNIFLSINKLGSFEHEIIIFPNNGESHAVTLNYSTNVNKFKIAELFYGCIFEQLYKSLVLHEKYDLWKCWTAFSGFGSADYNMVMKILEELGDRNGDKMGELLNVSEQYLENLIENSKINQIQDIFSIYPLEYMEFKEYKEGDIYKVNIELLSIKTANFIQFHQKNVLENYSPKIEKVLSEIK